MIVTKSTEAPKLGADLGHRSMRWRPQKMFSFLDEVEKRFLLSLLNFGELLKTTQRWKRELVLYINSGWGTGAEGPGTFAFLYFFSFIPLMITMGR